MSKYRIVLADDHKIFREGLKSLLKSYRDFQIVAEAKNGQELLEHLKEVQCDLVITDLNMPDMDGMEALSFIRSNDPKIKIIVLTMQKDHEHFKHAMSKGALGYVIKDDTFEQLAMAIRLVMKGQKFVSSSVEKVLKDRFLRSFDDLDSASLEILTKREMEVLRFIAKGLSNKSIAVKLKLSTRTIETHRANLGNKLGIHNTAGLVKYAISKNLL